MTQTLNLLVNLSRQLGDPARDYVILGEGNTSAQENAGTFWVKASGTQLHQIQPTDFVQVRLEPMLDLLAKEPVTDAGIAQALTDAKVDSDNPRKPSVETMLHALCLAQDGVDFVGHTHPTAVNSLTCSRHFENILAGRIFPDEIVYGGIAPLLIPYVDPGLPLTKAVGVGIERYIETHGVAPKAIWLKNHGLLALGKSPQQVLAITAMAVKTAGILQGTMAFGGPHYLTEAQVNRIHTRPDEQHRRRVSATA
jgi:rhamnose utilization protein RhaD (predicted bifunctional aldolase and dehydrogenase)